MVETKRASALLLRCAWAEYYPAIRCTALQYGFPSFHSHGMVNRVKAYLAGDLVSPPAQVCPPSALTSTWRILPPGAPCDPSNLIDSRLVKVICPDGDVMSDFVPMGNVN